MNKYARKILKYLNKHSSKDNPINIDTLYNQFNYDKNTIDRALKLLDNESLININRHLYAASNRVVSHMESFYPTTMGKNYRKDSTNKLLLSSLKLFLKSIFCPILVSLITTLLTIWLAE